MDPENLRIWLQGINMIGTFGIGCWLYLERRNDKTNDRIGDLAIKVDQLDKDVTALEASTEKAPSHNDLAKVYDSVNSQAATLNQLVGESREQSGVLRLILNRITERGMK